MITNNLIKRYQALKHRKYRREYNQFLIEGKRIIHEAIKHNAAIHTLLYTESFKKNNQDFIDDLIAKGCRLECIPEQQINKISVTKTPSGIIAVCTLSETVQLNFTTDRWLYLDHISDPGNLGTLLRTAAWFQLNNIALTPDSLDPYNPKVVRAGMGAHFHLAIHSNMDIDIFIENNYYIVGADHRGELLTQSLVIPERWVLVLGGEAHGLSGPVNKKLDRTLAIPKSGAGESLNVSAAGAILMHQLSRK